MHKINDKIFNPKDGIVSASDEELEILHKQYADLVKILIALDDDIFCLFTAESIQRKLRLEQYLNARELNK